MSYYSPKGLRKAIRQAVRYNRRMPVIPKALLWTDFPDTDEDLFGPDTKEDMRRPISISRRRPKHRRQRLHARLTGERTMR